MVETKGKWYLEGNTTAGNLILHWKVLWNKKECSPLLLFCSSCSFCRSAAAEKTILWTLYGLSCLSDNRCKGGNRTIQLNLPSQAAAFSRHTAQYLDSMLWGRRKEGLWPCLPVLIDGFCCSSSHFKKNWNKCFYL